MSAKVLFISYQFPPIGGPGVQRSTNFVKYLSEFGWEPIVFTIREEDALKASSQSDHTLLNMLPAGTRIFRVPFYQPLRLIRFLNKCKIFRLFWFFFYPLFWERMALWPFLVFNRAKKICRLEGISHIYTSSGPFSSLLLGFMLKKFSGKKWVADMRDPYTDAYAWEFPSKVHWYFSRVIEKKILSACDVLIVNTAEVKWLYLKRGINPVKGIHVITNGY